MVSVLLATASVHTTAAACDYLGPRLDGDDSVHVLAVEGAGIDGRDAGDATNVARTRLVEPAVETEVRAGDPAGTILDAARDFTVDELVVGATSGDPDERTDDPPGSTVGTLLEATDRPVTVLPAPAPA